MDRARALQIKPSEYSIFRACSSKYRTARNSIIHYKKGAKQLSTNGGTEGHGTQEVVLRMHRGGGTASASATTPNGNSR